MSISHTLHTMKIQSALFFSGVLLSILSIGCAVKNTETGSYIDGRIYNTTLYSDIAKRSFLYEGPVKNPVIVIHGLLGSRLDDLSRHENIWGDFVLQEMISGEKFPRLAHPMRQGVPLSEIRSNVSSAGLLERSSVEIGGFYFKLENYERLVKFLTRSGYVPDKAPLPKNRNFHSQFIFHYDWRRDIAENAVKLDAFIREKSEYLKRRYRDLYGVEKKQIKFDVIAHSMGGLLARYYTMYGAVSLPEKENATLPLSWKGAEHIAKVIMVGTPNAGYSDTFLELLNGLKLVPAAPVYPKAVIGTFVSYYEMLPDPETKSILYQETGKEVDVFSPALWRRYKWGLADPDDAWLQRLLPSVKTPQERRRIALDHLDKCLKKARQFRKAMRAEHKNQPEDLDFYLFSGDSLQTNRTLLVNEATGKVTVGTKSSGDGKITSSSTVYDRRDGTEWTWGLKSPIHWRSVFFINGGHMGIMNNSIFEDNLSFILLCPSIPRKEK